MTELGSESVLDCRGQLCPQPVIELARHIRDVPVGTLLRVLVDDPAAPNDLAAWCRLRGQEHLGQEDGDASAGRASVIVTVRRLR